LNLVIATVLAEIWIYQGVYTVMSLFMGVEL
jgi:hypothetical protein